MPNGGGLVKQERLGNEEKKPSKVRSGRNKRREPNMPARPASAIDAKAILARRTQAGQRCLAGQFVSLKRYFLSRSESLGGGRRGGGGAGRAAGRGGVVPGRTA